MRSFLSHRWFLLLLSAGLALAVLRPGWFRPLGDRLPLRLVVALSLFLMAWGLEGRRLWLALTRPAGVLWALAISFAFLPLLALLAGFLLPNSDLKLGLLIIACVPCTLSSAVLWTRHAGGDEALALLIVVSTNGLGWLVTPLWLASVANVKVELDPVAMMQALAVVLVVPVALGQAVRFVPGVVGFTSRHRAFIGVVARLLVAAVLICATADGASSVERLSAWLVVETAGLCVGLHLAGVFLGLAGGRLLGLARSDRIAIAISGSQKTLPVGLVLLGYYRHDYPLAVLPLLLYHAGAVARRHHPCR